MTRPLWLLPALLAPALLLAACNRAAPADEAAKAVPGTVAANGFTLVPEEIELPTGRTSYPDGPNAELVNADCLACHSPAMALTQPKLTAAQWRAIVTKMRDTYKASVPDEDIDGIVAYFLAYEQAPAG